VSAINMGIIGVGNCGSSLAQGLVHYVDANDKLIRLIQFALVTQSRT